MELTITRSIQETLDSLKVLTRSQTCWLITNEGPWQVCSQRCELPDNFLIRSSLEAKDYLSNQNEIHLLDQRAIEMLGIPCERRPSSIVYIPLNFEHSQLGVLLLELKREASFNQVDRLYFKSIADISSQTIGNALKSCMLAILEYVSHLYSERMELVERLQMITDGTKKVFGEDFQCEIYLYDPIVQVLTLKASTLIEDSRWNEYTSPVDIGLNGWVIQKRQPIGVSDVLSDSRAIREHARMNNIHSICIAPIENHGRILGVVDLFTHKKKDFSNEELWILNMLGQHAGIAINDAMAYSHMKEMAMIDPVTECFSRQYFATKGKDEVNQALRNGDILSLLILDIDHFKQVNDTHGHPMGDLILRQVTSIIENNIRINDICARYGGEEFVVVIPQVNQMEAVTIAERIRQSVQKRTKPSVTISIGVSSLSPKDSSIETLIERADQALYYSKKNGRNQVSLYDELDRDHPIN